MKEDSRKIIPAYLFASSIMPEGHGSLEPYGKASHPIIEKFGGELLIAGMSFQKLDHYEGNWAHKDAKVTLFKFPSMQHLRDFWYSDEYQAVKHLRTDVIEPNFTLEVEGFDEEVFAQYIESAR